ncbi:MAG: DNA polymerase III subunit gamma/tau [Gammaproteobacteria bacterium]|uniref:DNA polymerase III subunit gamma/tau n=1 Tax=Rhodoferax sp. TaxID=50421 RepID=UPI0018039A56|nr:DNA polymerase III subunit gamma/tau [Rhodoferax sp.]MBU3897844.1 DNA polymerase III subunit gamma/tau [Gammaproteobacteria bacterium]MBA3059237.1 DNA polymerase III subunit gamma/tau [Rhodoferax sp.]MBU3997329.1 DNA polymerase III subunit gamma/tau [Gammaproteobacteria bacterium]MBU4017919.1 DNA polymerase III subunit gamma/tau [Gammaproteobacteria bacterium]MBU4078626.1 DNA polymerase III subunit gamma/tau [Gammaproteobacteria bacterium]
MSYLVLARKYRPRNFTEMVGQDHVVQALTNALTTQRLHHAYLFTGTRGVGKTTVSRILAKSLNCQGVDGQGGITATPCGVCQACSDINAGRFVDYTELDAASNRGVDEVQALLEQAVYKPVQGRFKVFMIDEVHMLTGHAFNAMLKTLEEPPEYLKFVLATTDPQKVPVTVLSRCLQFNLRPIAPETIREHLQTVLQAENVAADVPSLKLLARAAHGSMRDALSLADQAISFGAGQIEEATVRQMLGSVDRSYVFRLLEALARCDGKTVVETSEALRLNGLSAAATLEEMSMVLQRMAVLQLVPSAFDADESDPQALDVARLAALMPADETQLLYSICLHGRAELGLAPDEYAALTMVLLRLLAFKPGAGNAPVAEKKTVNDARMGSATVALRAQPAAAQVPGPAPPNGSFLEDKQAAAHVEYEQSAIKIVSFSELKTDRQTKAASEFGLTTEQAAPSTTSQSPPPGQHLHVVQLPPAPGNSLASEEKKAPASVQYAQEAVEVIAIPVRVQADSRTEAVAGQTAAPVLVPTEEGAFWHTTVSQLIAQDVITAMVRELALQSQLIARDTDQWLLRVERESLNQPGSRDRLATALQSAGHAVRLVVEIGRVTDSPARRNAALVAERQLAAEKIIFDDPFVQTLMRDFGAKIVPGSISPG